MRIFFCVPFLIIEICGYRTVIHTSLPYNSIEEFFQHFGVGYRNIILSYAWYMPTGQRVFSTTTDLLAYITSVIIYFDIRHQRVDIFYITYIYCLKNATTIRMLLFHIYATLFQSIGYTGLWLAVLVILTDQLTPRVLSEWLIVYLSRGWGGSVCLLFGKPPLVHFQSTHVFIHVYIEVSEVLALDSASRHNIHEVCSQLALARQTIR